MSTAETILGIALTVSVIVNVWIVLGGRFIMRRLERQIRRLQGDLLTALHTADLWKKEARRLSDQLDLKTPRTPSVNTAIRDSLSRLRTGDTRDGGSPRGSSAPSSRPQQVRYNPVPPTFIPSTIKKETR